MIKVKQSLHGGIAHCECIDTSSSKKNNKQWGLVVNEGEKINGLINWITNRLTVPLGGNSISITVSLCSGSCVASFQELEGKIPNGTIFPQILFALYGLAERVRTLYGSYVSLALHNRQLAGLLVTWENKLIDLTVINLMDTSPTFYTGLL